MKEILILTLSEASLKGKNKKYFTRSLKTTIKNKLSIENIKYTITDEQNKFYFELDDWKKDLEITSQILSKIIGISWIYKGFLINGTKEELKTSILSLLNEFSPNSYRISGKSYSKILWSSSMELINFCAKLIKESYPNLKVDLENYDFNLIIKSFSDQKVFVYTKYLKAIDGIPNSTTGTGLVFLSGGIDSPVASFLMQSRGLKNYFISFLTPITATEDTLSKIISLAKNLNQYNSKSTKLLLVDFSPIQSQIKLHSYENYRTILLRRAFFKFANLIASDYKIDALITGDALAQVASQTLEAQMVISPSSDLLVFKPLIGLNKEEIINKAKNIGTYDISIQKGDDMCSLFSPSSPIINPKLEKVILLEKRIENYDEILLEIKNEHLKVVDL